MGPPMGPRQATRKGRKNRVLVLTGFAEGMGATGDDLATASARVAQTGFAIAACLKPQGANRRQVLRTSPSWRYSSKASMPLCRGGAATAACGGPVSAAAPPGAAAIGQFPPSPPPAGKPSPNPRAGGPARRRGGSGDDPRHDSSNPRHDQSSITADAEATFCFEFLAKRGCDLSATSWPVFHS